MKKYIGIGIILFFFIKYLSASLTFIYPDPTIVSSPGVFEISINVDAEITDFRGYMLVFSYDSTLMEFISAEKGEVMEGFPSYWWKVFDVSADSLHIECMGFGAGLSVNGPGTILKLKFKTLEEGTADFIFKHNVFYDIDGLIMPGISADDGTIIINYTISIDEQMAGQDEICQLKQNYPNPFTNNTTICYNLTCRSHVKLQIFNSMGQLVNFLVDEEQPAGEKTILWNACDRSGKKVASGVYYYKLHTGKFCSCKKCFIL